MKVYLYNIKIIVMKKIILLFTAIIGLSSLQSCEVNDVRENQIFEAEVYEFPASFNNSQFSVIGNFSRNIYDSDHILIYRLYGKDGGADVWRLIPQTIYFTNGDNFDYNYDFTKRDFRIFLEGNFDLNTLNDNHWDSYIMRQIFRVVVVPGRFQYKMDFSDYDNTIKALGLENATVKKLK